MCTLRIRDIIFSLTRSGSHLYTANRDTLRSGHRDLVLLGSCEPSPLGFCRPSPFVPLLYHTLRGLSRGIFAFAGLFLLGVPSHPSWCPLWGLPPDMIIIPQTAPKVNSSKCTIMGNLRAASLFKLSIDKLLGVWYNGNFARQGRGRAAILSHENDFVNRQNSQNDAKKPVHFAQAFRRKKEERKEITR